MTATPPTRTDSLQSIPGVGPSIAKDLQDLGITQVRDLQDHDPQELFDALCAMRGEKIDRCVLYVFRCAVYFATARRHDPERLKWWNWTDDRMPRGRRAK
jgi:predicted RecB family nuclease